MHLHMSMDEPYGVGMLAYAGQNARLDTSNRSAWRDCHISRRRGAKAAAKLCIG